MAEVGAAFAAAQLLAFSKEPLRYRPGLTHGRETFPGGLQIFRIAQGRFPPGVLRELSDAERERLKHAAAFFIRQVCLWEGATHYQVLCVSPDARRETIKEHYHGLMALMHPDRQDTESTHWPSESAQRVNQAYAVLSDEALRRTYDAGLRKSVAGPAVVDEPVGHVDRIASMYEAAKEKALSTRYRFRRNILPVAAVLATMFFLQAWWTADSAEGLSGLGSGTPFEQYYQWTRDVFSNAGRPRFLGSREPPPGQSMAGDAGAQAEPESFLSRVAKAFSSPAPAPIPSRPSTTETAAVLQGEPKTGVPEETARLGSDRKMPEEGAAQRPQVPRPEVDARVPSSIAKAPAAQGATKSTLDPREMELLVVRVVSYYEAGDLERLLAMFDADSLSLWEALSLRRDFQDFFQTTSVRHLKIHQVSWDKADQTARARGQATLMAEYRDERKSLERNVALEMDIMTRSGRLRIARLALFPHD